MVRRGEKEERARGTRVGGSNRRCHSCGRSEETEAAGFGIPPAAAGGDRVFGL